MLSSSPRNSGPAEPWRTPANLSDVAQSRLFDEMLQAEIRDLEAVSAQLENAWLRGHDRRPDADRKPPEALIQIRGRVAEAKRMLAALRRRFPADEIRSA